MDLSDDDKKELQEIIRRQELTNQEYPYFEPTASIIGHAEYTDGKRNVTYEWQGPINGVVVVTAELLKENPNCIIELPWKMCKIGEDKYRNLEYYVRYKDTDANATKE